MELVNFSRWVSLKWAAMATLPTGVMMLAAAYLIKLEAAGGLLTVRIACLWLPTAIGGFAFLAIAMARGLRTTDA